MNGIELFPHNNLCGFGNNVQKIVNVKTGCVIGHVAEVQDQLKFYFDGPVSLQNLQIIARNFDHANDLVSS